MPAKALEMLVAGFSLTAIAKACDVDWRTAAAWADRPETRVYLKEVRDRNLEDARRRLNGLVEKGLSAVESALEDTGPPCDVCGRSGASTRDRLTAAQMLMDRAGLPKTEVRENIDSGVTAPLKDDDASILLEAATIAADRDRHDLADALRTMATTPRLLKAG